MPEGPYKENKDKKLENIMGMLVSILPKSSGIRKYMEFFVICMSIFADIGAFGGAWTLFDTAKNHNETSHDDLYYVLILYFAPLAVGVLLMAAARVIGYNIVRKQRSMYSDLTEIS